mmetsp:Transcript_10240/g.62560  ORF Transcript_10240/g.62560 Transcript_10240/m.62560 type:complete len:320 (-) Transcript_10240:1624-2583(-)
MCLKPFMDQLGPSRVSTAHCRLLRRTRTAASTNDRRRTMDVEHAKEVAERAARRAGAALREAFAAPRGGCDAKSTSVDLVTETDRTCEKLVQDTVREAYPTHQFIGEEESSLQGFVNQLTDAPTWICDPLDGTTNFVHRFPFVCVCVALAVEKKVVVGVVYNPILEECFVAVRGSGATLNGRPIHVSDESELGKSILATEVGVVRDAETMDAIYGRLRKLTENLRGLRCCGSCALNMCGVAMGRLDAFFEIGFGGPWDVAAAGLIVEEAGGMVQDPSGGPFDLFARRVLASNGKIGPAIAETIQQCSTCPHEPQAKAGD